MPIITTPFGHTGDYTIYQENYNLSRDLKSFLFHAIDKNFAYVSLRFLLGSQSFVMDASEIQGLHKKDIESWRLCKYAIDRISC
ncbi:hypothetical protein V6N13_033004 [Hibiscus sabdariffa]